MIVSSVIIHIMPYLSSVGIPRSTAGIVAAAIPLISIIGRFGFGWLGDVHDKKTMMVISLGMMGTGLLALCYVEQRFVVFIFLPLFSIGCWGSMILSRTIQVEYFGRELFGKMLGIIMGFASLGGIIGPTLAGWAFDTLKSYHLVWFGYCGVSWLSIGLILRMKPLTKTDEAHSGVASVLPVVSVKK
jgi:OFA family oxalate/formate antiporter-like MFS transporter